MKQFNTLTELSSAYLETGSPVVITSPTKVFGMVKDTGDGLHLPSGNVFVPQFDDQEVITGHRISLLDDAFTGNITTYLNLYSKDLDGVWQPDPTGVTSAVYYNGILWAPLGSLIYDPIGHRVVDWNTNITGILEVTLIGLGKLQFTKYRSGIEMNKEYAGEPV